MTPNATKIGVPFRVCVCVCMCMCMRARVSNLKTVFIFNILTLPVNSFERILRLNCELHHEFGLFPYIRLIRHDSGRFALEFLFAPSIPFATLA